MRITNLYVDKFLGVELADVPIRAPVALFCGANGSGKSTLRDAIALALTADLGRVSLKKEAPLLIREGAKTAIVEVKDADGDVFNVTLSEGKITATPKAREVDPILPYVLDAQRFASLTPTERRAFLLGLTGVKTDSGDVARRLEARGCHIGKAHRILPLLRSGFDAAHSEAKSHATEAKAAWRVTTGETYGPEKAKTWRAPAPIVDAAKLKELQTNVAAADQAIGSWQQTVGGLQAEEKRRAELRAALPALKDCAAAGVRVRLRLGKDRAELDEWDKQLARTLAAAGGAAPRVGLVHDLARALQAALLAGIMDVDDEPGRARVALAAYEHEHGPLASDIVDPDAQLKLPTVQRSRDLLASAVAHDERDLAAVTKAEDEIARIEVELQTPFDAEQLAEARTQIEAITRARAEAQKELDALRQATVAAERAAEKTAKAGELALTVAEWDVIAQALSPDGIPADLLSEALGPINERLAQSALDAEWPRVEIAADMEIREALHERPYRLLSESEQWRCDAMIAEAIAFVSGARLLVLDRMDVLDLPGRSDLLAWLDVLAENGEIDTALIFATLKAPPTQLGERVQVEWIEGGRCTPLAVKAA